MNKGDKIMFNFISYLKMFGKKFTQDRVLNQSASLTFITLLGFIPFLIFLFFLIPELPFASGESLENFLISVFVPTSAQQIGDYITQITTQKIPFNLFSFLLLIFTSYSLFRIINDTFDTILGATSQKDKKFFGRLLYFLGMCLGGVMLLIILLSSSSVPFLIKFIRAPFLQSIITYFSPFLIIFVVFSLGFFFIPSVKIRNISVLIGAGTAALIWLLFKNGFDWYINNLTNMEVIFGVVSFIPIFLFWIYANWVIILSGVVLVAILDGRIEFNEVPSHPRQKIRIIIEKEIDRDNIEMITEFETNPQDLKKALNIFVDEEKK
jgi:membrane protein